MKKFSILTLLLFYSVFLYCQETVSSGGEQISNSQAKVNFTIGEPIINQLNTSSHTILNGYQQPLIKIDTIGILENQIWNVSIFPNPSQDVINVEWDNSIVKEMTFKLFSINGKLIYEGKNTNSLSINISSLSAGNYLLYLIDNKKSQTYKVQKIK